jgi:hypothetical protein
MDNDQKSNNSESHPGQLVSLPNTNQKGYRLYNLVELFLTERRYNVLTMLQAEQPMKSGVDSQQEQK